MHARAQATDGRPVLVYGAGASFAEPAGRPLFRTIRDALVAPLRLEPAEIAWDHLAPEALLSRFGAAGIDVDGELRRMLRGGAPNALHAMAAELLRRGGSVWTTNFDELIEEAASAAGVGLHRVLPDDEPRCDCGRGHLLKVHGTLSGERVIARSEDVLVPLRSAWLERLEADLDAADVALVGYAGADVDLRSGLRLALGRCDAAAWFSRADVEQDLVRRFDAPLGAGRLELRLSDRPDLAALAWGRERGLTSAVTDEQWTQAQAATGRRPVSAGYRPNDLLRARVLDDFGHALEARRLYGSALRRGPRRRRAARALYSSGMIHGAPWRRPVVTALDAACALPLDWRWPHRQRLPYLTWNVPPAERLRLLERSLEVAGDDPEILRGAANAAKEVDPLRAVDLGREAQRSEIARLNPAGAAWATFTLSLALRWLGDVEAAAEQAAQLADGYDALAGPVWIAWGAFELAAIAALRGELDEACARAQLALEVFRAAGSMFAFDACCAAIAVNRAAGMPDAERAAYDEACALLDRDDLRRRFKREVLMVEDGEVARREGRLEDAAASYEQLARSPTLAQELLGLLGLGEVQRLRGERPHAAWQALRRSDESGFGYGQVHAAVTLGLAGAIDVAEAERRIAASVFAPPERDDASGLLRFCQGPDPEAHLLCFP